TLLRQQALIGDTWCNADDSATLDVTDPATGERLGTVPSMGGAETRRAVAAAQAAFTQWSKTTAKQRGQILRKWHDLIL
ncbi:aldehyde dehydrogenase family protein, partial [Klebsiella pneumoniae]